MFMAGWLPIASMLKLRRTRLFRVFWPMFECANRNFYAQYPKRSAMRPGRRAVAHE